MIVKYTDRARQSEEFALLQQMTEELKEAIGRSAKQVMAEWDQTRENSSPPNYRLHISHEGDSAEATYAPEQLHNLPRMRFLLAWLWGDLLQERSHRQLKEVLAGSLES